MKCLEIRCLFLVKIKLPRVTFAGFMHRKSRDRISAESNINSGAMKGRSRQGHPCSRSCALSINGASGHFFTAAFVQSTLLSSYTASLSDDLAAGAIGTRCQCLCRVGGHRTCAGCCVGFTPPNRRGAFLCEYHLRAGWAMVRWMRAFPGDDLAIRRHVENLPKRIAQQVANLTATRRASDQSNWRRGARLECHQQNE